MQCSWQVFTPEKYDKHRTDEILFNEGSHYSQSLTQTNISSQGVEIWLTLPHLRLLNFAPNGQYFVKAIPGVPQKTIPCLISCKVKPTKAISLK